ncbi:hypothetical protein HMPREF0367_00943 [[Eubacterium] cylindroides ATCC 27803]|uniref:Uncharacterized protein n=1 Tax=Faecalitalea cylindroides ATCC 27803 TaxID=649755 RepID=U2QW07_9FIRM|nr:hypothetical protein HMPREF0367_00943 [[Eubacterium] cylindroides ATCC 27803] [Faecalitalea cylindroides ATCC 27803]
MFILILEAKYEKTKNNSYLHKKVIHFLRMIFPEIRCIFLNIFNL